MSCSSSSASSTQAGAPEATLLASVKNASEKPLQFRPAGMAALTQLFLTHWANAAQNQTALKTALPILRDAQTFVNHVAAINEENIASYLPFYPTLFNQHFTFLQKLKLDEPHLPLYVTLVKLMVHSSFKIRVPILKMVRGILSGDAPHVAPLSSILLRTLHYLIYTKGAVNFSSSAVGTNPSFIWSRALFTIAAHPVPANVPLALFLSQDPFMKNDEARHPNSIRTNFEKLISCWSLGGNPYLKKRTPEQRIAARHHTLTLIQHELPEIEKFLFSDRGLLQASTTLYQPLAPAASSSAPPTPAAIAAAAQAAGPPVGDLDPLERSSRQRTTTIGVLLSLFRHLPGVSQRELLPKLYGFLSHPDFDRLTDESVAIWRTPEGQLCEFVAAGEFRAVAGENKNVKRPADWTAKDEELELRAKAAAAAAAKKPAPGAKGAPAKGGPAGKAAPLTGEAKVEFERKKRLEDQSALRAKLTIAKNQVEPVLMFFGRLAVRESPFMHRHVLATLLPKLHHLFANELVRTVAIDTHRQCIACLDNHVRWIGSRLSLSVETLILSKEKAFTQSHSKRLLSNTLVQLRLAAEKKPFSPPTFLYIFPIINQTIHASADPVESFDAKEITEVSGEEEEFKVHEGGAKKVQKFDEEGDEEDEGEEEEEEEEQEDEEESKEEKSNDEPKQSSTSASNSGAASSDSSDVEKPLAPGLQLSLSSASEVLNIHCAPEIHHEQKADEKAVERFPIASMYSALLHILGKINTLYQPTLDALTKLSSSHGVTGTDVTPLLGAEGILSPNENLRQNSLQALDQLHCFSPALGDRSNVPNFELFTQRVWIACHDLNAEVSAKASALWTKFNLAITEKYLDGLIALLTTEEVVIRTSVGNSIASAIQLYPGIAQETLRKMVKLFIESPDQVVSSNSLGLRQGKEYVFRWHTRSGIAQAIGACTDSMAQPEILTELFTFFIQHGLKDMNDNVWEDILNATLRIINQHGKQHMDILLPKLEAFLKHDLEISNAKAAAAATASSSSKTKKPSTATPTTVIPEWSEEEEAQNDRLREGVILSMGTLARHMDESNPSIAGVVDSLIESLRTPSHSVQKSVSECLAPLMTFPTINENAVKWIDLLLLRLHTSDDYGERKGAAFGLAGMVKGLKLAALKKYNILDQLAVMVQDKNSAKSRQGALFAYERLFFELGNRFEPYVVHILPHLLACYGDSNQEVRDATQDAARMIMSHLTGHGIKMVLPLVLKALEEKAWRTKLESIGLLSAMAYCSPQSLSACLPMIVPRLLEVNADANAKVQVASRTALKQIGSVIRNPEILTLVPVLLAALNDPTTHTKRALQDLMRTSFVHSVDPPSLALIIPILRKGLKSRAAITKKMSAQVVGSMCSLIGDVKDILPYSSTLLKYLKLVLVDPNPEVRAVAARALAALYKGIIVSEEVEGFSDLREWLMETLRSDDTTPTIRSGCAQGLAQLLAVQGLEATSQLLPTLFLETKSDRAVVREGFFNLFGFLPDAYQQLFSIFVADVLPVIVEGLADEIGLVREAALAAGQSLVLNFAQTKTDLLLPALEDGIVNSDWRIRLSSVQLLGVMLLRLAGVSVKMIVGANNHHEEDAADEGKSAATICTRDQENHIESVLGTERRNRLISTVYLMRCDVVPAVADLAFRVWKSIVSNSPRMLTTILPVLMSLIISDLASTKDERQTAAGRTLGELVSKMGDFILAEIVPILQTRLKSDDKFTRQGVCLGLSEVMASARKADMAAYMADIVPYVRDALCDKEEIVRKAAGTCFQTLLRTVGRRAVDDIVPTLLWTLDEEEGDEEQSALVLEGIKVILSINSSDVLPLLIPALAKTPLTLYHAKALAFLSTNFTKGFIRYVDNVTLALIDGVGRCAPEQLADMRIACAQVVLCVSQDCVHQFVNVLEETSTSTRTPSVQAAVAHLISSFTANTKTNYDSHLPMLMQILLRLFVEEGEVLQAGWDAMNIMMKTVPDERAAKHIQFVRSVISDLSYNTYDHCKRESVPGFNLKNGIGPLVPMFQHGLMHGTPALRVESADGLSDLINLTNETALGPFVIKITGPLIRIVGDRFPGEVKAAILNTLYLLILKCAKHLKPFLPQLQTTFIKALTDYNALVRSRGSQALAELITEPKRATTVLAELSTSVTSDANPAIKTSMLQAMVGIVSNKLVGPGLPADVIVKLTGLASEFIGNDKDSIRRECARLLAMASPYMTKEDFATLVTSKLMRKEFANWRETDGALMAIQALYHISGARLDDIGRPVLLKYLLAFLADSNANIQSASILALGELMLHAAKTNDGETVVKIAQSLAPFILSDVPQVRQDTASRFQLLGETSLDASVLVYEYIVPNLLSRSIDSNLSARAAVCGAMHTLFQFHQPDFDKAEKLLGAYHAKASKKDAGAATALLIFVKKSVAKAKISEVQDDLWKNATGESLVDPSAATSSSSTTAESKEDEDDEDYDE